MVEELIKYYKDNVSAYALVFRHFKITYTFSAIMLILLILTGYLAIITVPLVFISIWIFSSIVVLFLATLAVTIITVSILDLKAKDVVRRRYSIRPKKGMWRTEEFNRIQDQIFVDYLKEKGLYTSDKLELLIKYIDKDIERSKLPPLVAPGIFIALFVPIWSQYVILLFKKIASNNAEETLLLIVFLALGILFIAICVGFFKRISNFILDNLIVNVNIKKRLLEKLEDSLIKFRDESDKV
ncbi:hypothetical protein ABER61_24235 [Brevibacillus formosus]|uniref:Uncharacterized protein n=1 Tax=Brevibacillus formosus TaxID=54913 RepID=A0A837KLH8_9BACL|nr:MULTISPECIES: hypothetical protein [Brevibacillus]KLH98354.1 hypothetical protein AA984_15205 [Brevibacillus formosus]MED1948215.1 hypothetical protein [Brevibacillus formosus]MED1960690.1 hypothetical protein [Brevibacillus formosus]MED1998054.1 hypothetical protein [Brevibacillus formosus]MED2080595.1 hypothetical protein [Brevibacillus formosus]